MYKNVSFWLLITSFLPLVSMDAPVSRASLDDTEQVVHLRTLEESPLVEIWCIDVAQGNATVVGSSNSSLIPCLVDAGCRAYSFKGKDFKNSQVQVIIEKLVRCAKANAFKHTSSLPLINVIVSHPDDDHYNMVVDIIRGCIQKGCTLNRMILGGIKTGYNAAFLKHIDTLEKMRLINHYPTITWLNNRQECPKITQVEGRVKLKLPSYSILPALKAAGLKNSNTASLVVLVKNNDRKFLITADATQDTINYIRDKCKELQDGDGMYAAHHGADSDGSNSEKWFQEYIRPKLVVFSSGFHQGFRHPLVGVFKEARKSVQKTKHYHPLFIGIESKSRMADLKDHTFVAVGNKGYGLCVTNRALYGTMAEGTIKFILGEEKLVRDRDEQKPMYEFLDKKSCVLEMLMLKQLNETNVLAFNILVTVNLSSLGIDDTIVEDGKNLQTLTYALVEDGGALKHYYLQNNKIQDDVTIKALVTLLEKRGKGLFMLDIRKNSLNPLQKKLLKEALTVAKIDQQKRKKQIALKLLV